MKKFNLIKRKIKEKLPTKMNTLPSGIQGVYLQVSKNRGVKVYRSCRGLSFQEAFRYITEARIETKALRIVRNHILVPKCYGLKIIKIGRFYYPVIILQHLGETRLIDTDLINKTDICRKLRKKIEACGIDHDDLHEKNVMFYKNRYWTIDFGMAKNVLL